MLRSSLEEDVTNAGTRGGSSCKGAGVPRRLPLAKPNRSRGLVHKAPRLHDNPWSLLSGTQEESNPVSVLMGAAVCGCHGIMFVPALVFGLHHL
jgi:hypothetical protein